MSAPLTDLPPSSISSSGLVDGLGRRLLAFDRETGVILERLHLRPELAAFETAIRERIELLSALDDERFARPGAVQRNPESGELMVLSEFVAGSRVSDLLETAEDSGTSPGVDVALGFLLEALPAISTFHNITGFAHGLIEPTRMLITPGAGQVVFLDPAFGSVIERLGLSRTRLWTELGLAPPQAAGPVRLDISGDISQIALSAVMLVIGRRIREYEYPDELPSLLAEVVEVAQIRGSNVFATSLQRLLQRALPLPGRRPFGSADELANEIRLLLRREIGAEVCRQALLDFTEHMDAALLGGSSTAFDDEGAQHGYGGGNGRSTFGLDEEVLDSVESFEVLTEDGDAEERDEFESEDEDEDGDEYAEVSLDRDALSETESESPTASFDEESSTTSDAASDVMASATDAPPVESPEWSSEDHEEPALDAATPAEAATVDPPVEEADPAAEQASREERGGSRRRKQKHKSARARKDKLRSIARPEPPPAAKPQPVARPQPEAKPATQSGWLVSPDRAASFAPPVPEVTPAPPSPASASIPSITPAQTAPTPPMAAPAPVVPPPAPQPVVPMPVYGAPAVRPIVAPTPAAPPPPIAPVRPASSGAVRLKTEPPAGYAPVRHSEPMAGLPYMQRGPLTTPQDPPSAFPWKLAAAVLLIVGAAIVAGRAYMPSSATPDAENATTAAQTEPIPEAPPVPPKVETGDITVETQPSGARVLLDGKPVGQTPMKLAGVPVGRHVLMFVSSSGEVTRTVRVTAGKTLEIDVPIFSGWLAVFAPVVLDVSANGRSLGTTELSRLMIPPGRHELTLTNSEFGYKAVQEVTVEPGEVRSVTIDPRGDANFNAVPWAEVWMDGQKLGDTPLGNVRVPLGTREFVFRHPQYGERRITAIIRADQPTPVSVDFTRQ